MKHSMEIYRNRIIAIIFSLLLITGCAAGNRKTDSVRVSLVNIQPQKIKLLETSLIVELRIFNLNDTPLNIKGAECQLEISEKEFAFGVSDQKLEIPAFESTTLPVQVYSSVIDVVKNLVQLTREDRLAYRISGKLHLEEDSPGRPTISYESKGHLFSRDIR